MKLFLTTFALSAVMSLSAQAADCVDAEAVTGITLTSITSGKQDTITIWHDTDSRVIYDMQPQGLTRVYLKYSEEAIAYEEYFSAERIGVEHEPSPTNVPGGWSEVTSFVSTETLETLELSEKGSHDCYSTTTYKGTQDGQALTVTMIDELSLPLSVTRVSSAGPVGWKLLRLETSETMSAELLQTLETYKTYDFADLGDHEDEVFFRSSGYLNYKLGHGHSDEHGH